MCRSRDAEGGLLFSPKERWHQTLGLQFRAFYLRLSIPGTAAGRALETLTLVYLPRINANLLEINGAKVCPDDSAIVALHRVRSAEGASEVVFGNTDRVRAGEGVRFEVYLGEDKALKGVFRRHEGGGWRVECRSAMEVEPEGLGVSAAEFWVLGEGKVLMREKVEMVVRRRKKKKTMRHGRVFCVPLEEIPEEGSEGESDGCDCCCSCGEVVGGGTSGKMGDVVDETQLEGVTWAVDLGIWAVCLGVGFFVSRVSSRGLKKKRSFLF